MKVGDLVRPTPPMGFLASAQDLPLDWVGVIIDFEVGEPVVYWNEEFNAEFEYHETLRVVNEGR